MEKFPRPIILGKEIHNKDEIEVKESASRVFAQSDLLKGSGIPDKIKVKFSRYYKSVATILEMESSSFFKPQSHKGTKKRTV